MTHSRNMTRRTLLLTGGAALMLGACTNAVGTDGAAQVDARVDQTHQYLIQSYPAAQPLVEGARGVLYMPLMTEAALGFGGAYGQGALRIGGQTVDYYSATRATVGLQAGAQQYAHVLIFQTDESLAAFRAAPGWTAGAGAFYAIPSGGMAVGADTFSAQFPVVAMIFGQSGLIAGAAIEGTKYTRIIPSTLPDIRFGTVGMPG
ncbi:twin-arginine translocation pathway signal [Paracoccus aestuarii]|uniref:Twin-arginine translocation pathway signal n=2 Tax=Paracoccus aestuarii TaxID=453842 RepID=A0A418ZTY9_9RHOB|nr:YSC84-related protein [Paracoccus aestuarii]RJL00695.1 twin-arginine translocation pathway signal [Paracoccus aestuarii]WCQ99877.1 twin-arginine translocation pathway signal [Paracoccus aestuarii]